LTPVSSPTADFLVGVSASSVSTEGVAPAADWVEWEHNGQAPTSGDGSGLASDYRDDLQQFVQLGCNAWRLTIEWARIEPAPGRINHEAIDRYLDILNEARTCGLASWLTFQSTSLPGWYLDDEGGHRDQTARQRFWLPHVDRVAETFDALADGFVPVDDPIGWAVRGYGLGSRPPGRSDPKVMREAAEGAILAVHDSLGLLATGRQPVMTTWRAEPIHALAESDHRVLTETKTATQRWDDLWWGWLRGHADGVIGLPGRATIQVPRFVSDVDYVGLVHDHPMGINHQGEIRPWPETARRSAGLAPEPEELAQAIYRTREALPDHRLIVAGHGVATDDEAWRDDLLARSLRHVDTAVHDVGLAGYFHDSGIDGYDWKLGFARPRGLLDRDRRRKPAAETFRRFAERRSAAAAELGTTTD